MSDVEADNRWRIAVRGFAAWLLIIAFEVLFGRFVVGMAWEQVFAGFNIAQGGLMPFGLLVLFFSLMIAAKLRAKR